MATEIGNCGEPVEVTVEHTTRMDGSKEVPVIFTRRVGLERVTVNGQETLVVETTISDFGEKLGVSRCYTLAYEGWNDPEAIRRRRARIVEEMSEIAYRAGAWG